MDNKNTRRIVRLIVVSVLLVGIPLISLAQPKSAGNWLMYFGTNRVSDKLSIHTEIQYRNHTFVPVNTEQLLLRTGLNYHFAKGAMATAGYANIGSYEYRSEQRNPETQEHRIWQQLILTNKIGRVKFEHRYRVEQRWIEQDYRDRFRYRLMLFVPINKTEIEKGAFFIGLYDEIFVNSKEIFFDRNRLYGAVGLQFSKTSSVQVGMLHQQLSDFNKWYLQFALVSNLDFRK